MKVAIVTCSRDPDYVRAATLRAGFKNCKNTKLIVIKNSHLGIYRYLEVTTKLIKTKFKQKPDLYVLTFKGYELLFLVLIIAGRTPVVYDEFINPVEWLVYEQHKLSPNNILTKFFGAWYRLLTRRCRFILADTKVHAEYSAKLNNTSLQRYRYIPVSADEHLFRPSAKLKKKSKKKFQIFYYCKGMLPLHGLSFVLEAAVYLKADQDIEFIIAGGNKEARRAIEQTILHKANIVYKKSIDSKQLPRTIRNSDLCLAGPFGNTVQSKLVIAAKTFQFLACGVPAMIGSTRAESQLKDGNDCLIVPQANSRAIASKIMLYSNNRKKLSTIGRNGKKAYDKFFSNKVVAQSCQSIMNELFSY